MDRAAPRASHCRPRPEQARGFLPQPRPGTPGRSLPLRVKVLMTKELLFTKAASGGTGLLCAEHTDMGGKCASRRRLVVEGLLLRRSGV